MGSSINRIFDRQEANDAALQHMEKLGKDKCGFVHPFDNPIIWEGHSSMVEEIKDQLNGITPDAIIVSVGGGGLLMGVHIGLQQCGWGDKVKIVTSETYGADSLYQSQQKNEHVLLDGIKSIAKTLGAVKVCEGAYKLATKKDTNVICKVVTDLEAIDAIQMCK